MTKNHKVIFNVSYGLRLRLLKYVTIKNIEIMLYSEDKKIIIRLAARIVESKEPEKEVIDVLYEWQRYMLFDYRVQMLYDELCIIGYEDIADYVKKYSKKKYNILNFRK